VIILSRKPNKNTCLPLEGSISDIPLLFDQAFYKHKVTAETDNWYVHVNDFVRRFVILPSSPPMSHLLNYVIKVKSEIGLNFGQGVICPQ